MAPDRTTAPIPPHSSAKPHLSIALCSHNGGRFLPEQLASIAAQTRPPDELVVCDDASADDTPRIVRDFAATAPFPVRVEFNPVTLGSTANFGRAVGLCRGEVIALADQDDVWHPDKLARIERAFAGAPAVGLVFGNAALVDHALRPTGRTLWDSIGFGPAERRRFRAGNGFACLLRRYRVTGATTAFRACYRDLVLPIPAAWLHDAWIALLIAAVAGCEPLDEVLINYRQHPAQQVGGGRPSIRSRFRTALGMTPDSFRAEADRYAEAERRLRAYPGTPPARLDQLAAKIDHWRARARMRLVRRRWPAVLRELGRGRYARYSHGWKAAAQDLFLG